MKKGPYCEKVISGLKWTLIKHATYKMKKNGGQ